MTEERPNQRSANGGLKPGPEVLHRRYFWLLACAWTAVAAGSFAWNLVQDADEVHSLTAQTARALLEKDLLYREWSALHGEVYVPISALAVAGTSARADRTAERHEQRFIGGLPAQFRRMIGAADARPLVFFRIRLRGKMDRFHR